MLKEYTVWQEYYVQRLDWAYKAKNNFIETLENDTFKKLYSTNSNKSVNIAVYGQSQVGKTTLILELIGVKKENRQYISEILRADIPQGESVTPTSIIYIKSNNNDFYYTEGGNECLVNEDELKQKLKNLRDRVEKNVILDNLEELKSNILIKIPKKFFKENNTLNINIIDLPGFGSANEKEQRHVTKVIENIIPILNLVLIVSDKITSLVKSDKPCRQFRYILTRSVSSSSVKRKFEEGSIINKANYLEFVRGEFNALEKLSNGVNIYPLEYGDSWDRLDKNIKDIAEGIIDELFEDLRKDISESSTEYNQLMQNKSNYQHIEQMILLDLEKLKIEIEGKEKITETLKNEKSTIDELNHHCIKKIEDLNQSRYLNTNFEFSYNISSYSGEAKVSKLKSFLSNFNVKINEEAKIKWNLLEDTYPDIQWKSVLELGFSNICSNEAIEIRKKLNDYFLDDYFTDNFKVDKKECEDVCLKIYLAIKKKIETSFKQEVAKYNKEIANKIIENEKKIKDYKNSVSKKQIIIKKIEEELQELKTNKNKFEENSKKSLVTAKKFKDFIKNGYIKEKNNTIGKMNSLETSKETKLFNLLYLSLISSEFEKLDNQPV
jgi:GTP-binding protein EngB required for normal cell division